MHGVHIAAGPATSTEQRRAAAMVAALMRSAAQTARARRARREHSRKAVFHKKMAQALFDYKLYKVRGNACA